MKRLLQGIRYLSRQLEKVSGVTAIAIITLALEMGVTAAVFNMAAVSAATAQNSAAVSFEMPKSHNPLNAYEPSQVPEPQLANSPLLNQLIRDGKLYLSLKDAIRLALEDNLDIAIARYNLPIADTDVLRTQAGGAFRGVNAGVVQGTPGGGVGGFGTGARRWALAPQWLRTILPSSELSARNIKLRLWLI
jgi:hypothetical protein